MNNTTNLIVYLTINNINGKIYVGKDEQNNPQYLGSGKLLKRAFSKYGKENFSKHILENCDNKIKLSEREKHWISRLEAQNPDIGYNITLGGDGGNTYIDKTIDELNAIKEKIKMSCQHHNEAKRGKKRSIEIIDKITKHHWSKNPNKKNTVVEKLSNCAKLRLKEKNPFYNKTHNETSKQLIATAVRNRPKQTCEFCGRELFEYYLKKYHGTNCKLNPNNNQLTN